MQKLKNGLVIALAIAYLLSPLDLIPDPLVPFVGWLDDLGVLALAWRYFMAKRVAKTVVRQEPLPALPAQRAQ